MAASTRSTVRVISDSGPWGFAFLLAYIGAAVYFVGRANGFWEVVLGLLEAAVWPAFVVYQVLVALHV
jgi:hypothetical protein